MTRRIIPKLTATAFRTFSSQVHIDITLLPPISTTTKWILEWKKNQIAVGNDLNSFNRSVDKVYERFEKSNVADLSKFFIDAMISLVDHDYFSQASSIDFSEVEVFDPDSISTKKFEVKNEIADLESKSEDISGQLIGFDRLLVYIEARFNDEEKREIAKLIVNSGVNFKDIAEAFDFAPIGKSLGGFALIVDFLERNNEGSKEMIINQACQSKEIGFLRNLIAYFPGEIKSPDLENMLNCLRESFNLEDEKHYNKILLEFMREFDIDDFAASKEKGVDYPNIDAALKGNLFAKPLGSPSEPSSSHSEASRDI